MTLASTPHESDAGRHGVSTVLADRTRASVSVRRDLDAAGIGCLERVLDAHYAAGRRFLRINLAGVSQLDSKLVALLERTHYRMLASRGTSIVTGARREIMRTLADLGLDRVLLLVETSADEEVVTLTPAGRRS